MKRHLIAISGWLTTAMVVFGGVAWAGAQATPPDGSFVRTADGSVWVVSGGARIAIKPVADSGNVVASLRDGGAATNVNELQAALAALAPPPPGPANPAETLIGQHATMCSYGVNIDIEVASVEWTKTVLGATAPGNGMWIVAFINVTNLGTKNESLYSFLDVKDERDRVFEWRSYPPDPVDLSRAYGVKGSFENFSPGITEQSIAVFQVPSDVRALTLEGKTWTCGT